MTLGEISDIVGGATPNTQNPSYWNGSIPWCTPTDVTGTPGKYLESTAKNVTVEGLQSCGAQLLPSGAVLLCTRATIGEVRITKSTVCTNQGFRSLIARDGVSSEFLYYYLLTRTKELKQKANGSTFLELGRHDLASIEINVPSQHEQHAMVQMLSDLDETIRLVERLIQKKRDMKCGIMHQLLVGEVRLPGFDEMWMAKHLGDVAWIRRGELISSSAIVPGPFPVIAAGVAPVHYHHSANRVGPVIAVSASGANAGYVSYWERPVFASDCSTVSAKIVGLHLRFLFYVLKFLQDDIFALQHGGAQPHVYPKDLTGLDILLPGYAEQEAIARLITDVDREIETLERQCGKIQAVKRSMMQQLFSGRIRLSGAGAVVAERQHVNGKC